MAIGTPLEYYTGNGWTPARLRANIPEGTQGMNRFRIYLIEEGRCVNVPPMAVRQAV